MTSIVKGDDLLVGWTNNDEQANEDVQEEPTTVSEKIPLATGSSTAAAEEGGNDNYSQSHESKKSSKQIRRWGIRRIPKEGDSSDGEYYDESNDDDDDDDVGEGYDHDTSTKSLVKGMTRRDSNKQDDSHNDSNENGINQQPFPVDNLDIHTNECKDLMEGDDIHKNTQNEQQQQQTLTQAQQSKGIWQRISSLGIKQDEQQENDSNVGLLKIGNSENDVRGCVGNDKAKNDKELVIDPPGETVDDILVRSLSNRNKESTNPNPFQDNLDSSKNTNVNGNNSDNEREKETFTMKNPIEGFGSNPVSPPSQPQAQAQAQDKGNINTATSANPLTSGISNFFQAIQLRRIKARHEFDPFSLTEEELEILKQDILRKCNDLDSMEQMKIDGSKPQPKDNLKKSLKNIQSAVLAPEAFAAYTDRMVDEEDGDDNMGLYRNVPLGGEDDIYDDYELRKKKMKPMKMEGDDVTWSDVVEAVCDPEAYVIDEDMYLEDLDPLGVYRGLPAKCDDDDNDDSAADVKEKNNPRDTKEIKKLQGEIQSLTEKVQKLVKQLHAKDEETQKWKTKALELEKDLEEWKGKA